MIAADSRHALPGHPSNRPSTPERSGRTRPSARALLAAVLVGGGGERAGEAALVGVVAGEEAGVVEVERGLAVLSSLQEPDGGYASWGSSNSESVAQVIVALTELGVPLDDERFVKNGVTVEDALLRFAQESGAFVHVLDGSGGDDGMATEQAFYALAAIHRAETGETTLYDMTDVMQ